MKINYKVLFSILAAASVMGLAVNYFNPEGISLAAGTGAVSKPENVPLTSSGKPDAEHINVSQAYNLYKQGAVFLDAREEQAYMEGHIHKAVSLPLTKYGLVQNRLASYQKDQAIVTYCSGTSCNLSSALAEKLVQDGYTKVYVFFGGWNEWLTNNYPLIMNGQLYNAEG